MCHTHVNCTLLLRGVGASVICVGSERPLLLVSVPQSGKDVSVGGRATPTLVVGWTVCYELASTMFSQLCQSLHLAESILAGRILIDQARSSD
jgi:hypothetical protein